MAAPAVQELLGHATIEMTMRYAHLTPDVTRDAVMALEAGRPGPGAAPARQHKSSTRKDPETNSAP